MKRMLLIIVSIISLSLLSGCAGQPASPKAKDAAAEKQAAEASPASVPAPFVPADIFGGELNPFHDVKFPSNFAVYAAAFNIGDPKWSGMAKYTLSMTAEGETDGSIAFLAELAGIKDEKSINEFLTGFKKVGFCEFQSADGGVFTIRRTDRNDNRYQYVEGCHIDLGVDVAGSEAPRYVTLVKDNYNVKALSAAADYFDVTPVFDECEVYVNLYKKAAEMSARYDVQDVSAVQQKMGKEIKSSWYDGEQGKMGLSYGMIDLEILFDDKGDQVYVSEKSSDMQTALSAYTAPAVSLSTLGFNYAEKDALCIYEDKEKGILVAIHKPEWGSRDDNWNIEYLQEVNGYLLAVWYKADEQKYTVQADKGSSSAKYDYFLKTGEYGNEYPDPAAVKEHFSKVFAAQDDDVFKKAVSLLEQTLQDRFGMSREELYALPVR